MFLAFKRLSRDWNINCARAYAQGVTYIDISSGNSDDDADQLWQIHKENGGRWVKNYAQGLKRIYRREELGITDESFVPQIPKMHTCSGGDAPGDEKYESTNDATMLQHAGGFTDDISDGRRPNHNGWPIYLNDYYGLNNEVELINRVLRDFIIGHGHPDKKRRIESRRRRLDNLLNIIALERQLQWTQNPNTQ